MVWFRQLSTIIVIMATRWTEVYLRHHHRSFRAPCIRPPHLNDEGWQQNSYLMEHGDTKKVQCSDEYSPKHVQSIQCLDGHLKGFQNCVYDLKCQPPLDLHEIEGNGNTTSLMDHGEFRTFRCPEGFLPDNLQRIQCLEGALVNFQACQDKLEMCQLPKYPFATVQTIDGLQAPVKYLNDKRFFTSTLTVTCEKGFLPEQKFDTSCHRGHWKPECVAASKACYSREQHADVRQPSFRKRKNRKRQKSQPAELVALPRELIYRNLTSPQNSNSSHVLYVCLQGKLFDAKDSCKWSDTANLLYFDVEHNDWRGSTPNHFAALPGEKLLIKENHRVPAQWENQLVCLDGNLLGVCVWRYLDLASWHYYDEISNDWRVINLFGEATLSGQLVYVRKDLARIDGVIKTFLCHNFELIEADGACRLDNTEPADWHYYDMGREQWYPTRKLMYIADHGRMAHVKPYLSAQHQTFVCLDGQLINIERKPSCVWRSDHLPMVYFGHMSDRNYSTKIGEFAAYHANLRSIRLGEHRLLLICCYGVLLDMKYFQYDENTTHEQICANLIPKIN